MKITYTENTRTCVYSLFLCDNIACFLLLLVKKKFFFITMMPARVVPPVDMTDYHPEKMDIGPLVIMSGFVTKKTRSLNRWKQRWWQLLDNGYLLYFKSDDRVKLLGQIDIARTCYDVRLGSEKCRVKFPQAAPSCCCFSFAVLKRTYYMYTPTAGEAKGWSQSISDMSRVINRRIVAGVEHRKAPDPPRPSSISSNYRIRVTRVRTGNGSGISDSCEDLSRINYLNDTSLASKRRLASSVPDCLDRIAASFHEDGIIDSRLWLDGSPPEQEVQVHPKDELLMSGESWTTVTIAAGKGQASCAKNNQELEIPAPRNCLSKTSSDFSLPVCFAKESEHNPEASNITRKPAINGVPLPRTSSAAGNLSSQTTTYYYTMDSDKKCKSIGLLQINNNSFLHLRPIPKPRKGKAAVRSDDVTSLALQLDTEKCSWGKGGSSLSLPPSKSSKSRSRRNTAPPLSPPSTPPPPPPFSTLQMPTPPRKENGKRCYSKAFSPPSSPPPPPPPASLRPALRPRVESAPLLLPLHYRDSGPPNFVPPPPSTIEELEIIL